MNKTESLLEDQNLYFDFSARSELKNQYDLNMQVPVVTTPVLPAFRLPLAELTSLPQAPTFNLLLIITIYWGFPELREEKAAGA